MQRIDFKHIICFIDSQYVVLEKNQLCEEQNIIDNENECTLIAEIGTNMKLATRHDGIIATLTISAEYPRGCYLADYGDNYVWFNRHPVGNRNKNAAPFCLKGKCMCS